MLLPILARLQALLAAAAAAALTRTRRAPASPAALHAVRRIQVIRLDELGDVVLSTAFLRELRRAVPAAHITLVVQPGVKGALATCDDVDELLTLDVRCRRALRPFVLPFRAAAFGLRQLRRRRPDLVILPRWDADQCYATVAARFSAAPLRVGFSHRVRPYKRRVNAGFDWLLTHTLDHRGLAHEVDRSRALLRWLGAEPSGLGPSLGWGVAEETVVDQFLAGAGPAHNRRWIALSPSFGHSVLKQWPTEHFVELARRLVARGDVRILLVGAEADRPLAARIAGAVGDSALDLTGKTTLAQLPALLARCALFVGADTGVMHVAGAVGVPVIGIFGPTNTARFAPWGGDVVTLDLPCSPIHRQPEADRCRRCVLPAPRCMTDLGPALVYEAVAHRLDGAGGESMGGGGTDARAHDAGYGPPLR